MAAYSELRIRFEPAPDGAGYAVQAQGLSGEADGTFRLPTSKLELENLALRLSRGRAAVRRIDSPELDLARRFGGELFDALFSGQVRDLYRDALSVARSEGKGLRVTLALTNVPELMHVPWEYLYDDPAFLSISTWTPVVRYLDLPRARAPLPVAQPLRILGMVSSPSDVVALDVGQEQRNLEQALADLTDRGGVEVHWLPRATLRELQRELRRGEYHIFHFVGHGGYDAALDDGVLLLEDDLGRSRRVGGAQLGAVLADETTLRLAVLNSCEGARTSSDDPYAGVATSLLQHEVPAVVAMQFEITDRAAIVFATEFYSALADGYPVDSALAEARKAIFADENDVEWGTPVLYMRVPDGRIFDVASASGAARKAAEPAAAEPPTVEPPKVEPPKIASPTPTPVAAAPPVEKPWTRSRRRRWLGAAAIVAVGAVAGVLAVVLPGGGGGSGGSPPGNTGGPGPVKGGGTTSLSWTRHDVPAFGGRGLQTMTGVATRPGGNAVAVGWDRLGAKVFPAAWLYDSTGIWRRVLGGTLGARNGVFHGVASRGSTVVAVGTIGPTDDPKRPSQDALVWRLASGAWQNVCGSACGDGAAYGSHLGQTMYAVVARPWGGFVAVGYDTNDRLDEDGQHHYDAAVWTSPGGGVWSRVDARQRALGGQYDQVMRGLTVTSSGVLVAVGWSGLHGAVWTSSDGGERWTAAAFRPKGVQEETVRLNGVVQDGSRLVAYGFHQKRPGAWTTADLSGRRGWQPVTQVFDGAGALVGAVHTGEGLVAVGHRQADPKRGVAAVWRAATRSFTTVASGSGGGSFEMTGVVQLADGRLLAVGDGPSASGNTGIKEEDARVWTSTRVKAPAPAPAARRPPSPPPAGR